MTSNDSSFSIWNLLSCALGFAVVGACIICTLVVIGSMPPAEMVAGVDFQYVNEAVKK